MKKIFIILGILLFLSGNAFAIDRSRYESSTHKFRSQFTDSEWARHQQVHERFRSWEDFNDNYYDNYDDDYRNYEHRQNRYYNRYNDSIRYDREYDDDWEDNCYKREHSDYEEYEY